MTTSPLVKIIYICNELLSSPFTIMGLIISKLAHAAPVPCPKTVTADGFPPKAAMLSLIQINAAV